MKLDATDLRLLDLLQQDAARSNQDLAAAAHTSAATALRRVRRLVDAGVIERQVALLSPDRIGVGLTAIVEISLDRQGAEHLDAFEQRVAADDEVQQLWKGVAERTGSEPRPRRVLNRALVGVAATLLVMLGVGRVVIGPPVSSAGRDASIVVEETAPMTEGALSVERGDLCSRPEQGIGFHCGYLALASR